VVMKSLSSW